MEKDFVQPVNQNLHMGICPGLQGGAINFFRQRNGGFVYANQNLLVRLQRQAVIAPVYRPIWSVADQSCAQFSCQILGTP